MLSGSLVCAWQFNPHPLPCCSSPTAHGESLLALNSWDPSFVWTHCHRAPHRGFSIPQAGMVCFPTQIQMSWETDFLCFLAHPLPQCWALNRGSNLPQWFITPCSLPICSSKSPELNSLTAPPTMGVMAPPTSVLPMPSLSLFYFKSRWWTETNITSRSANVHFRKTAALNARIQSKSPLNFNIPWW